MSETPHMNVSEAVVTLSTITQLRGFENIIAGEIVPKMTKIQSQIWDGRPDIVDILRPPKFHGRIVDVELAVMDDPYERLLDATERGWKFHRGGGGVHKIKSAHGQQKIDRYRGFAMTANALSTGRGVRGQVQAELYYYPTPDGSSYLRADGTRVHTTSNYNSSVKRVVTMPRLETETFTQLDETAKRIGLEVFRDAILHPIIAPHQG